MVTFKELNKKAEEIRGALNFKLVPCIINGENLGDISIYHNIPIDKIKKTVDEIVWTAFTKGPFQPVVLEVAMRLGVVQLFTNIKITAKEEEKPYAVYDAIETLNLFPLLLENIDKDEYNTFVTLVNETVEHELKYRSSIHGIMSELMRLIPEVGEASLEALKGFDPDQLKTLQEMSEFAKTGEFTKTGE